MAAPNDAGSYVVKVLASNDTAAAAGHVDLTVTTR
jgi:hypothetical protein